MLAKLSLCRTHVLGGRKFRCADCAEITSLYNSCGDRHCPRVAVVNSCSGGKRVDFHDKATKLILSGVTYYQVVFTLPSELSELALANRYEMADLLVDSAWKSLSRRIKAEQDYDPAAMTILHTWNQKLEAHWHVHMLVPGAGPGLSTRQWTEATAPTGSRNSDGFYLVDADPLREAYREQAIGKLRRLRSAGKLKLVGKFEYLRSNENWDAFVKNLESKKWVAYIQPPPSVTSSACQVVRYLTRYLTGGPISDRRIVAADADEVTFMARDGKRVGGEREQVPVTMSSSEFVGRWCLHIQPDQLTKTRYLGGWSNNRRGAYQDRCREQLEAVEGWRLEEPSADSSKEAFAQSPDQVCEHCGSDRIELIQDTPKPSWAEIFRREDDRCPEWYADRQRESHRRLWTASYGTDFYDWYVETQVESAEEIERERIAMVQLPLAGFTGDLGYPQSYLVDSF
ncbi:Putative transposase [Rubripirellula lacrimiformis]|uniref:Transposase n=1 Tax=Rubripirellula lacrimiformis TaxID=1930273 RepID=A0A517N9S5_9BACT|nr:Putative transposase [Rubripirellula lacrimiformis]